MRRTIIFATLLFLSITFIWPALCSAQSPCNTHHRKLKNPFTWLESNMCQEDYDKWVKPRLKDRWYKDKIFWAGIAVIAVSQTLDAHSTSRAQNFGAIETNPILGRHPCDSRIAVYTLSYFAFQSTLHYAAWKQSHNDSSKSWRVIGQWGLPATAASINGVQGIKNYRLGDWR